jgi:hypothetical protein
MPIPLAGAFGAVLLSLAVPMVVRALVGIGVGAATYVGVNALLEAAKAAIWAKFASVSGSILTLLVMANVDDFIKVVLSALSTALVLKGWKTATDSMSRMSITPKV